MLITNRLLRCSWKINSKLGDNPIPLDKNQVLIFLNFFKSLSNGNYYIISLYKEMIILIFIVNEKRIKKNENLKFLLERDFKLK